MLLLLAGLAAPAAAQTTVTSSGRDGSTVCPDRVQVNAGDLTITALSTTSVTYMTPGITWNQYVTRLGDVPAPTAATVQRVVYNASTGSVVNQNGVGVRSGTDYSRRSVTASGLAAKTPYYAEVKMTSSGNEDIVFARRCFMTGGTYTMNKAPGTTHENNFNSGCYSISPLTMQHVRNCWCGRKTTLPLFSSTQDNTDFLNMWGCR